MDGSMCIKQEPVSPIKKTFSDANSPLTVGDNTPDETADDHLQQFQDGKLLPLIKNELKYTILSRRFAKGMGEIVLQDPVKPKPKKDLTAAELERKSRRREQNRRAATKCRYKKKDSETSLITTFYKEETKRASLQEQVTSLKLEKERLEKIMAEHLRSHECAISPLRETSYTPPLSAQYPPTCYDPNAINNATSPSLYGGDIFTFDFNNSKPFTMTSEPNATYFSQLPGVTSECLPMDTVGSADEPLLPMTPPADDAAYRGEFNWAECFLNIPDILGGKDNTPLPILNSDDLNNLAPPGP